MSNLMKLIIDKFAEAEFDDLLILSYTLINIEKIKTETIYIKIEDAILPMDLSNIDSNKLC